MCLNPRTIKVNPAHATSGPVRTITVPCGHCLECLKDYQNQWLVRLVEEFKHHRDICFMTLTYNNDTVPMVVDVSTAECHLSVCKNHVVDWIKRFRENYANHNGFRLDFKYFITSEYGPRTLRPHYHCLFFGLDNDMCRSLSQDWESKYGFTNSKMIPCSSPKDAYAVGKYVSKYCSKGFFENPKVKDGIVNPTFRLISKGIGADYVPSHLDFHLARDVFSSPLTRGTFVKRPSRLVIGERFLFHAYSDDYLENICNNRFVFIDNGKNILKFKLPRYYAEKIFGCQTHLSREIADFLRRRHEQIYSDKLAQLQADNPSWSEFDAVNKVYFADIESRAQRQKELKQALSRFYDMSQL